MTYTLIAHQELTSSQASITFSSIPATFTDLYLVVSARGTTSITNGWDIVNVFFNGVTTNRSRRALFGTGSVAGSDGDANIWGFLSPANTTANTFSSFSVYIPNYRSSAAKSVSLDIATENNATSALAQIQAGLWNSSDAITSITLDPTTGDLAQYSSATLYGITSGSSGGVVVS